MEKRSTIYFLFLFPLFFLSGASSLIFEILWQRKMMHVFGASAPAITAILTAFFFGIALGSWLGGRILFKWQKRYSSLSFYALTELWIGIWGLSVPFLLAGVDKIYLSFLSDLEWSPLFSLAYRFVMSVGVVLPASIGMGATIPIMSRLIHQYGPGIGRSVAVAYGINTLGAVCGCLAAGFLLLQQLGLQGSLYFASTLNALVLLGSVLLIFNTSFSKISVPELQTEKLNKQKLGLIVIYFFAGILAIGLEIMWFRVLAIFNTNGLVTFTLGLSVYLAGFSMGSLILFPLFERKLNGIRLLFLSNLGIALSTFLLMTNAQAFQRLLRAGLNWFHQWYPDSFFWWATLFEAGNAFYLMFLPTLFMGLSFPAVCQAIANDQSPISRISGSVYFLGNIGSMIGAILSGLILIPFIGLKATVGFFTVLALLLAVVTIEFDKSISRRRLIQAASFFLVLAFAFILYGQAPYIRAGKIKFDGEYWHYLLKSGEFAEAKILRYRSGPTSTVSVREFDSGFRKIFIDGQAVASTFLHAKIDSKMLAHIPLMLHPNPKRALTVGFGSGGTSWSMTTYNIETHVAEIEPEVIRSASLFESQNHKVLESPKLKVILNDARNHLYTTKDLYDVISTDVTNLQYKQNGNLYSKEYFELMKSKLTPNGVACAWIPLRGITDEGLHTLLRTFQKVYPYASLWFMDHTWTGFAILIGTPRALRFDYTQMKRQFANPAVRKDLAEIGIFDPLHLIHFIYLDENGMKSFAGSGPVHTDNHPILEFDSHVSYYYRQLDLNGRLQKMWELKPKNLLSRIKNLPREDRDRFERQRQFSKIWGRFNIYAYFSNQNRNTKAYFEKSIQMIKAAIALVPDYPWAKQKLKEFESRLEAL